MEDPPALPTHTALMVIKPVDDRGPGPLSHDSRDGQHRTGLKVRTPDLQGPDVGADDRDDSVKIAARPVGA